MSNEPKGTTIEPSLLLQWEEDLLDIGHQIEALVERRDQIAALIAAAKPFAKSKPTQTPKPSPRAQPKAREAKPKQVTLNLRGGAGKSWTATILRIVNDHPDGISYAELKDEIGKTHLGSKLAKTEKSLYGGALKLSSNQQIVRHNGWLFTPASFKRFEEAVKAGKIEDKQPTRQQRSPVGEAVKAFLENRPNGATSAEIVEELKKNPELSPTLERNKTHIYNVLSRLVDRDGELVKGGSKYYVAPDRKAA